MSYIENISVPYAPSRSGLVQRTGPSTENSPGERELFDHTNLWIPGPAFNNVLQYCTVTGDLQGSIPCRYFPKENYHQVVYCFRRPRRWDDGNLTVRIWYGASDDFDDTKDIYVGLAFELWQEESASPQTYSTMSLALTAPGAIFKTYIDRQPEADTTGKGYVEITSEYDLVKIFFQRVGNDANDTWDGDLGLIGIEVLYRPRLVESTGLSPWLMKE